MARDAHIGYAPSRIYGTPTTMLWVYRLTLEHAKQFLLGETMGRKGAKVSPVAAEMGRIAAERMVESNP